MEASSAIAEPPCSVVPRPEVVPGADRPRVMGGARLALVWGIALSLAVAVHASIGLAWLTRPLPAASGDPMQEPAFDLDLSEAAAAGEGVPDPVVEAAPDVPAPEIEPPVHAETAAAPVQAKAAPSLPEKVTPPADAVVVPARPLRTPSTAAREAPSATEQLRERARARQRAEALRAQQEEARARAEAARSRADDARRRPDETRRRAASGRREPIAGSGRASAAGARPAPTPSAGASAAASAAWRNQIVSILRGRFAGGSGGGMASVNFSVTRGGQIAGPRLTSSSGNPRLDAAALAAFRGSVPPPPTGYVGALTFNIRLGVR